MRIVFEEISITTNQRVELVDISSQVEEGVRKSGIRDGLCLVHALHSTVALVINEHEGGLMQDIINRVQKEFPRGVGWLHDRVDDNAAAHLASVFMGSSKILPIKDGRLVRGTWQNLFLLELDGPRGKSVMMEVLGNED